MRFLNKYLIVNVLVLFVISSFAFAHENKSKASNEHGMWICTTNASGNGFFSMGDNTSNGKADNTAKNNSDKRNEDATSRRASEEEQNRARSAKDAFAFAMKHCRDCTKITCEMQNPNR